MRDVNELDVTFVTSGFGSDITTLGEATGVNESGWIVGWTKFDREINGAPSGYLREHGWILVPRAHDPGDLNCDWEVSPDDIDPFILALLDPEGYATAWPSCDINLADMNNDQVVDGADIEAFTAAVLQWTPPPTGACCLQDTSCVVSTEVDCGSIHSGSYQGDGASCSPSPCLGAPLEITFAEFFPVAIDNCPFYDVSGVIVTGTGFVDGATIVLRNVAQPTLTIVPVSTNFNNPISMDAWVFSVDGEQTGIWELLLTNPDGEFAIAPQTVEVTSCP
jgi:hypothetical protein